MAEDVKPVVFVGDSRKALLEFPEVVRKEVGFALFEAQRGRKHPNAKPLTGLDVFEIVSDYDGNTYRGVYTVKIGRRIYVLHAFQKKAKKGIATPLADIALIKKRLRDAKEIEDATNTTSRDRKR